MHRERFEHGTDGHGARACVVLRDAGRLGAAGGASASFDAVLFAFYLLAVRSDSGPKEMYSTLQHTRSMTMVIAASVWMCFSCWYMPRCAAW